MPTTQTDDFMAASSYPAVEFKNVGDMRTIVVREVHKKIDIDMDTDKPKTWPNGDPVHVFQFNGESDGETKSLWVRGNLVKAVREAVAAAGLATVIDAKLTIKFDDLGTPPKRGLNAPKLFKVKAEAAAPPPADDPFANDEDPF